MTLAPIVTCATMDNLEARDGETLFVTEVASQIVSQMVPAASPQYLDHDCGQLTMDNESLEMT